MTIDNPVNLAVDSLLAERQRIEFGLRHHQFFVGPAHGDELANERHLEFAIHLFALLFGGMFLEPVSQRINEREVTVHVLVLNERATHDDLRDENERDDIGGGFGIADERRNTTAEGHATHGGHEEDAEINPEHPADLQDVVADQNEKNALNQGKHSERHCFR